MSVGLVLAVFNGVTAALVVAELMVGCGDGSSTIRFPNWSMSMPCARLSSSLAYLGTTWFQQINIRLG